MHRGALGLLQMSIPRNSMTRAGPRRLCGAHCSPNSASNASRMRLARRVSSSVSPTINASAGRLRRPPSCLGGGGADDLQPSITRVVARTAHPAVHRPSRPGWVRLEVIEGDPRRSVHSLHNTKVRIVAPSEAETGVEEISTAAGTSGSISGVQFDMPPSWPNSPVNTPRPQPDPPSQPPGNGTAPAAAAPSPPSNQPGTPQTMNNLGQPAAPDLPSFLPAHLKVINESGVTPSFIHHGEKVTAFPDEVAAPNSSTQDIEYNAALDSYEAFNPTNTAMVTNCSNDNFGIPSDSIQQAQSGDVGLSQPPQQPTGRRPRRPHEARCP